ncbi:MAG TPA: preprotein translocase subunit SecE [Candidatus Paceibacterota bacterium]
MSKIGNYLKEVKAEMAHVSWPTRKQTILFTGVVIALSLGMAIYLGLVDYIFNLALGNFFK